jgi:hypothetical protein
LRQRAGGVVLSVRLPAGDSLPATTDVAISEHRIATNGIELHVLEAGEGPAVVLAHGFGGSKESVADDARAAVLGGNTCAGRLPC